MKLFLDRDEKSNIIVTLEIDGNRVDFQYPLFVERLYDKDTLEPIQYSEKITADERTKIDKMLDEIVSATKKREAGAEDENL